MAFMLFFDCLNVLWIYFNFQQLPIFSIFGALVLVYTEFKSVREKTDEKFRKAIADNPKEIIQFVKDNRHLIYELMDKVERKENEKRIKGE